LHAPSAPIDMTMASDAITAAAADEKVVMRSMASTRDRRQATMAAHAVHDGNPLTCARQSATLLPAMFDENTGATKTSFP
jgi:hypothetical protein